MTGWIGALRHGSVWTRERITGYAAVLLVWELIAFAYCAAGAHGLIVPLEQPNSSDFVSFYAAGVLTDHGTPALAYDRAAHHAAEQQAIQAGIPYNFFYYPPVFLFVCAMLARLPYLAAFCAFQASCLLACLAAARRIVPTAPLVALLAFPASYWAIGTGQNALLTAALLAVATLTVDTRPVLAGIAMGLLCYKPHLGLLLPVALVAGQRWRAFTAAAASTLTAVAASILVFGWTSWSAFLTASRDAGAVYGVDGTGVDLAGLTNVYGAVLSLHGGPALAIRLQILATSCVMIAVAWAWARPNRLAIRAAILLAGIPIAAPIVLFYDLMVSGLAIAWLVRDGQEHGFPSWQRTGLLVAFVLPIFSGNLDPTIQAIVTPLEAASILALALRAAMPVRDRIGVRWLPE